MKSNKVSIIIPIYNVEKYIEKCLNTIINQTYKNIEIILIDDGSTDKSSNICDKYSKIDERIKVIHKQNEGVSIARNDGIELSTGKYIVFIDPDDYVSKNHIETLYSCININNVDLVISNAIDVTEDGRELEVAQKTDMYMDREQCLEALLSGESFAHVCWGNIYKRELLKDCRFNHKYRIAEDLDFLYRYISRINSAYFLSKNTYYWLKRYGSATNSQYSEKWNDELEIWNSIIVKTRMQDNNLYKKAIEGYIRTHLSQVKRFSLDKEPIKIFKRNIKIYKTEIFKDDILNKKDKLKVFLFLKSYSLFKFMINLKNK